MFTIIYALRIIRVGVNKYLSRDTYAQDYEFMIHKFNTRHIFMYVNIDEVKEIRFRKWYLKSTS